MPSGNLGGVPNTCQLVSPRKDDRWRDMQTQARHKSVPPKVTFASRIVVANCGARMNANSSRALLILFQHAQWELAGISGNWSQGSILSVVRRQLSVITTGPAGAAGVGFQSFLHGVSYNQLQSVTIRFVSGYLSMGCVPAEFFHMLSGN
jgi:hypothetical protein